MTYPHNKNDKSNNSNKITLWLQNQKGIVKQVFKKPYRMHDTYAFSQGQLYLIWHEEFE